MLIERILVTIFAVILSFFVYPWVIYKLLKRKEISFRSALFLFVLAPLVIVTSGAKYYWRNS